MVAVVLPLGQSLSFLVGVPCGIDTTGRDKLRSGTSSYGAALGWRVAAADYCVNQIIVVAVESWRAVGMADSFCCEEEVMMTDPKVESRNVTLPERDQAGGAG